MSEQKIRFGGEDISQAEYRQVLDFVRPFTEGHTFAVRPWLEGAFNEAIALREFRSRDPQLLLTLVAPPSSPSSTMEVVTGFMMNRKID